ncbi:hypothetical protein [Cytobacillus solani]|uniref:Uncharacterized protein n=1 Tax=Cytobacillus solani TaxID=1637975 RepID=A0A0Q3T4N6_9BACI|nr:hypothetical protein [Cytobacillus solani]KOP81451.1 hypothetical protein AMS60_02490 [Bacillus sp. FJAT-21945]KQL18389.1 hypothetical protein AN957_07265 [Cytobacillus solani]
MDYTSVAMMALIWGALLVYFLTPFQRKTETKSYVKMNFSDALKYSFIKVTFHKKAILALAFILISLSVTSWSQNQDDYYNEIHGISSQTQPINYTMGIVVFSVMIYLLIVGRKTIKLFRDKL